MKCLRNRKQREAQKDDRETCELRLERLPREELAWGVVGEHFEEHGCNEDREERLRISEDGDEGKGA